MSEAAKYLASAIVATVVAFILGYYVVYAIYVNVKFTNDCYDAHGHVMVDGGPADVCMDSNYAKDLFRGPVLWPMHGYPKEKP